MNCFNATSRSSSTESRVALFGPQVTNWTTETLSSLQFALLDNPKLDFLKQALLDLPSLWHLLESHALHGFSGAEKLQELQDFATGAQNLDPQNLTNTQLSSLTVVSHAINFIQTTESSSSKDGVLDFPAAQGFCVGFLSAAALASANDWAEFESNFSNAVRLAACIGLIIDAERSLRPAQSRATAVHVRWKSAEDRTHLETCLDSIPEAYISCITDDRSITITLPTGSQADFCKRMRDAKIATTTIGLHGRYHHPANTEAADTLSRICAENRELRLPDARNLRMPLRSTADAQTIEAGALHEIAIQIILCKRAHWFQTVKSTINNLSQSKATFVALGGESCIPRSLSARDSHVSATSDHEDRPSLEEIAVVGMACRFPRAENLEEFRQLLWAGETAIGKLPPQRFDTADLSREPKLANFWGNFLDSPDVFDHRFFGISGREAKSMDPQQRLALQVAYEALESSGYCNKTSKSSEEDIGCYLGVGAVDYEDNVASHDANAFAATGTLRAFISGRISHFFGWTGPSITFDTACSSSAVAIHTASKAILGGECSMALAGGVNVITSPSLHQNLAAASFLNPNGSSRAFDAEANGYCRGEGAGILVLKKLSKAIADGNSILGVVAGSAVNQGSSCSPITVPDSNSQSSLYKHVLSSARIEGKEVTYVEAHGTGTPVGDPIEYESVRLALASPSREDNIFLGSVKDNIGHTEAASGVAGVIKSLLMMQYKTIPKQANFKSLNPRIQASSSEQITVPRVTQLWTAHRQIALVNNYGAAGSNVAIVLRAHSSPRSRSGTETSLGARTPTSIVSPILLSAKTANSLQSYMEKINLHLRKVENSFESVAYNIARNHNPSFEHRLAFIAADEENAMSVLSSSSAATNGSAVRPGKNPVVLCFGGQTSRSVSVSIELYERCDIFKNRLDECNSVCQGLGLPSIFPGIFQGDAIEDVVSLHSMLLSLQISCAKCWIDCGLEVDTMVGHSFGQYAALCVADSISLKDAFLFVSSRARLIRDCWGPDRGTMLSVECDKGELEAVVRQVNSTSGVHVDFACYNGPRSFVLAGDGPSIERLEKECSSFKKTRLRNSHAYHSYLADDILDDLAEVTKTIKMQAPRIRVETCSAGGTWSQFAVGKMVQHTREPVYFADAVQRITSRLPSAIWLEAGSSTPIVAMARRVTALKPGRSDVFIPVELGNSDAITHLAKAACQLWTAGSATQHWLFHPSSRYRYKNLNLPPYQFEKSRHWIENKPRSEPTTKEAPSLVALLNKDGATTGEHLFAVDTTNDIFELAARGHAVTGQSLCPASMYIELAARCVMILQRTDNRQETQTLPHIEGLTMSAPLGLGAGTAVFLRLRQTGPETWDFSLFSRPSLPHDPVNLGAKETEHAKGSISSFAAGEAVVERQLKLLQRSSTHRIQKLPSATGINGAMVYGLFSEVVNYASYYRGVQSVSASENEAVGHVTSPTDKLACMKASICDLISLDNFLQVAGIHVNCLSKRNDDQVYMCTAVEEMIFSAAFMSNRGENRAWTIYTRYEHKSKVEVSNDIFVCDATSGVLVLAVLGANFRSVPFKSVARSLTKLNKPTATNGLASLHISNSENMHDSAYQTRSPSPAEDDLAAKQSFDAPLRQLSKDLPPSPTVAVHQQPNNLIQLTCSMFSAILEIPVEEIKPTSSLEELGIDSLLATEVLSEILTRFNVSLTQAQLITCTDVLSLVQLIQPGDTAQKQQMPVPKPEQKQDSREKLTNGAHLTNGEYLTNGDIYTSREKLTNGDSLANGYHSPSGAEESQSPSDSHESHLNLAVESCERFTKAKALYDHQADTTGFTGFCTEAFPVQSKLVVQYVVNAFASLGSYLHELESGDEVPAFTFDPRHEKLVPQLYKILVDAGLVAKSAKGTFCRTNTPVPTLDTSALLDELLNRFPKHTSETKLLYTTGHRLADCLSGSADPISLIFRDAAARTLLEDVYTNAPMFKTGTLILAQYLSMALERVGSSRELKILELGAGTGGTSKNVIDTLVKLGPGYKFSYTFTDLSSSLVATARRKFSQWPFMQYTVLDIEKEPKPEFLGAYDIILSTNCIHATKNLVQSTTNIRKMLRPDGILCLVELTRNLYWFDLVFGLLEGWWLFNDGREHALASERRWERELHNSGFQWVDWSDSATAESDILRVITASPHKVAPDGINSRLALANGNTTNGTSEHKTMKETLKFKEVDGLELLADLYYPPEVVERGRTLPVALMIHGGGHIMLSRNDIRPEQTSRLLQSGFLPISVDYRLCPETNLIDGPMTDVADALHWVRATLPQLPLARPDIHINPDKVAAIGWSTGGHLAMTLAWTSLPRQIRPPEAILAFYCPTDYEDPFWMKPNVPAGASSDPYNLDSKIWEGISDTPITGYNVPAKKRALGGWLAPSDARSRLALHMNTHGHTLHVLLGGLSATKKNLTNSSLPSPTEERIRAASPLAQIRAGKYNTPTFLIHPREDDLIPWQQAERTWQGLREQGVQAELRVVEGVPHLFDVYPRWADDGAVSGVVREGYAFLARAVGGGGVSEGELDVGAGADAGEGVRSWRHDGNAMRM